MKFVAVALLAVVLVGCEAACPNIISRSEWGARPPSGTTYLDVSPVPWVVVHHGESASCSTMSSCISMVQSYQNQHMDVNGWADIGYSFVIGGDGNIYEGRGWDLTGAHAPGFNSQSIGVCFIGSFMNSLPVSSALTALDNLIQCGIDLGKIQSGYGVIGHRQAISTDCPGDTLYDYVTGLSHWEPNP